MHTIAFKGRMLFLVLIEMQEKKEGICRAIA
jgi:hypothetical protein